MREANPSTPAANSRLQDRVLAIPSLSLFRPPESRWGIIRFSPERRAEEAKAEIQEEKQKSEDDSQPPKNASQRGIGRTLKRTRRDADNLRTRGVIELPAEPTRCPITHIHDPNKNCDIDTGKPSSDITDSLTLSSTRLEDGEARFVELGGNAVVVASAVFGKADIGLQGDVGVGIGWLCRSEDEDWDLGSRKEKKLCDKECL